MSAIDGLTLEESAEIESILARFDRVDDPADLPAVIEAVAHDLARVLAPLISDTPGLARLYRLALLEEAADLLDVTHALN